MNLFDDGRVTNANYGHGTWDNREVHTIIPENSGQLESTLQCRKLHNVD